MYNTQSTRLDKNTKGILGYQEEIAKNGAPIDGEWVEINDDSYWLLYKTGLVYNSDQEVVGKWNYDTKQIETIETNVEGCKVESTKLLSSKLDKYSSNYDWSNVNSRCTIITNIFESYKKNGSFPVSLMFVELTSKDLFPEYTVFVPLSVIINPDTTEYEVLASINQQMSMFTKVDS